MKAFLPLNNFITPDFPIFHKDNELKSISDEQENDKKCLSLNEIYNIFENKVINYEETKTYCYPYNLPDNLVNLEEDFLKKKRNAANELYEKKILEYNIISLPKYRRKKQNINFNLGRKTNAFKIINLDKVEENKKVHNRHKQDVIRSKIKVFFQDSILSFINPIFKNEFPKNSLGFRKLDGKNITAKITKKENREYFSKICLLRKYFSRSIVKNCPSSMNENHNEENFLKLENLSDPNAPLLVKLLLEITTVEAFNEIFLSKDLNNSKFLKDKLGKNYYSKYSKILEKVKTLDDIIFDLKKDSTDLDDLAYLDEIQDYAQEKFLKFYL